MDWLFGGIYKRGAGLGPAAAFLYSGPAINALAIILTARVLGVELGAARAAGAVLFSVFVGLAMAWVFLRERTPTGDAADHSPTAPGSGMGQGPALALPAMLVLRSLIGWKKTVYVALVVVMATVTGGIYGALAA